MRVSRGRAVLARLGRLRRAAVVIVTEPLEAFSRVRNRVELVREGRSSGYLPREEIRRRSLSRYGYAVADDWERELHELLGVDWPCEVAARFPAAWGKLMEGLAPRELRVGSGLDADPAVARAGLCLTRHLRPLKVVETGVARGIQTRFILEGFHLNGQGHLWSIDLPPLGADWYAQAAVAVPYESRARWTFIRGSSRRHLPRLLGELGQIDLFVHDSQHTERNMRFEIELAWARLAPEGALLVDDIHENAAFQALTRSTPAICLIAQEEIKTGLFGIALKRGDSPPTGSASE